MASDTKGNSMSKADLLSPDRAPQFLNMMLRQNNIVLISASYCNFCTRLKKLFIESNMRFVSLEIDIIPNGRDVFRAVQGITSNNTVPQVFIRGHCIGGYDEVLLFSEQGRLQALVDEIDTVSKV
eukprot:PhM_4_TR5549/c0_g1_i1/m.53517/K03676/grxC, GLRX, GLRX2; glutaredoxin 3